METNMNVIKRNNVTVRGTEGSVIVYAHGFGCNQDMWNRITPAFDSSHRQVLFDYVGSGKSDSSCFDIKRYSTLQGYAQDILDVCDALDLHRDVIFVGHSVSCSTGILASIARPELFSRMVLVGPSPCFLNHPPEYLGGFERDDLEGLLALMEQNYIGWANYLAPIVSGDAREAKVSNELYDSFCSTDPLLAQVFAKATFFADNRKEFSLATCPALILQHQKDALVPLGVADYMHQALKNSTLTLLDVMGHSAHMSHPELVIKAMRDYLTTAVSA